MPIKQHRCDGISNHYSMRSRYIWYPNDIRYASNVVIISYTPFQSFQVVPGETALAFYTAVNPTDVPVIGVSTYNVIPFEAAQYFNKIQCFCFEAQQLNPHEEVWISSVLDRNECFDGHFNRSCSLTFSKSAILFYSSISGRYAGFLLHWSWICRRSTNGIYRYYSVVIQVFRIERRC